MGPRRSERLTSPSTHPAEPYTRTHSHAADDATPDERMCGLHRREGVGVLGESGAERVDERLISGYRPSVLVIGSHLQGLRSVVVVQRARVDLLLHHCHDIRGWVEPQPVVARLSRFQLLGRHALHSVQEPTAHGQIVQAENRGQRKVAQARVRASAVHSGAVPDLVGGIHEANLCSGALCSTREPPGDETHSHAAVRAHADDRKFLESPLYPVAHAYRGWFNTHRHLRKRSSLPDLAIRGGTLPAPASEREG